MEDPRTDDLKPSLRMLGDRSLVIKQFARITRQREGPSLAVLRLARIESDSWRAVPSLAVKVNAFRATLVSFWRASMYSRMSAVEIEVIFRLPKNGVRCFSTHVSDDILEAAAATFGRA